MRIPESTLALWTASFAYAATATPAQRGAHAAPSEGRLPASATVLTCPVSQGGFPLLRMLEAFLRLKGHS